MARRLDPVLVALVLLAAAILRVYRLDDLPPGWRDDEVVETAVHAQQVLQGGFPIYFPQAEGHEPLYHYVSAGWMALVGRSLFAVRMVSVAFALFSLAALYRLARSLLGRYPALVGTAGLALSFWGLMYARFKLRHVSEIGFMLLAFYFIAPTLRGARWAGLPARSRLLSESVRAAWAGLWLGLCLYTYFAARAVPLILMAFAVYLLLVHPREFRARWRNLALALGIGGLVALPLAWAIALSPGGEARLRVVGQPLLDLLRGDWTYALRNTGETLGMFAFTGDPEYLYNIPGRPVFEGFGAALFLGGVGVSVWRWREPRHAFMLLWLIGGLAPAFVSTPAASLGHTIAAQPVVYLFPGLALAAVRGALDARRRTRSSAVSAAPAGSLRWTALRALPTLGLIGFLGLTAARDLHDYFVRWPALDEVRYLYRADLHAAARWLNAHPPLTPGVALASRGLHQADAAALQFEAPRLNLQPRLFDPQGAMVYHPPTGLLIVQRESAEPKSDLWNAWPLTWRGQPFAIIEPSAVEPFQPEVQASAAFANGMRLVGYTARLEPGWQRVRLWLQWLITPAYLPPASRPIAQLSGSPIPLKIFSHVLRPDGSYLAGEDRLDVDPATLQAGDVFVQALTITLPPDVPAGEYALQVGLYDPVTGARVRLETGEERVVLTTLKRLP